MVCKRGATWPMHSAGSLGGCEEGEVEHGGLRMVRSSIRLLFLNFVGGLSLKKADVYYFRFVFFNDILAT